MKTVRLFNVVPLIPEPLRFLEELSRNMWWCWHSDAIELFRRINPQLWRDIGHNPLEFLGRIPQKRFETLTRDDAFLRHLNQVRERFESEVRPAFERKQGEPCPCVAYFSLEYGFHESVKLYSGGLGVLAGDYLKAVSDLHLPVVAVGLLYRQGYLQQYLNKDGWQQERYPENEIQYLPIRPVSSADHQQMQVSLRLPEGEIRAAVWQLDVGRVRVFLLDTNLPVNPPELRRVTARLYGGDANTRLRQELLLGIAGFRALLANGYEPRVCHMNEGHAAFMSLGRVEHLMKHKGLDLATIEEILPRTAVFTTHTPVPAGNETFPAEMVRPHLEALETELGFPAARILEWSKPDRQVEVNGVCMPILGLRMAHYSNAVSRLHGDVARRMWTHLWPDYAEKEIPIEYITNGVHVASWLSPDLSVLFDRYMGPEWRYHPADQEMLAAVSQIPDEELWRAHELGRSRLVRTVRELSERQSAARQSTRGEIMQAKSILDHDALTIGFARRFATYKRATLLLRDPDRLEALLTNEDRPVQIIFAGKAHPADDHGKDLIRQIIAFSNRPSMRRKIVFVENYDMYVARRLVQGADLWLNTPRRPQEASGTSGMKAACNGGINCSVLDGWWCEGYSPECGWAIGGGEEYSDHEYQDSVESQALYNLLENEIVPSFYERPMGDLPHAWIKMMRESIRMSLRYFTSHRMAGEYQKRFYAPAHKAYDRLMADNAARARRLVAQHRRLNRLWHQVQIAIPECEEDGAVLRVGDTLSVSTAVHLGELRPEEVEVDIYYGRVDTENRIVESNVEAMEMIEDRGNGSYLYRRDIVCPRSGRYGLTTRVVPSGEDWKATMPGFVTWANGGTA